jgi:hypothetical protein
LDDALRAAYAAVVIVIFTSDTSKSAWSGSLERVIAVIVGCACALAVSFLYDKISNRFKLRQRDKTTNHETSE